MRQLSAIRSCPACLTRRLRYFVLLSVGVFLFAGALLGQSDQGKTPPAPVVIPDGTPVQLRFAQALWVYPISPFIYDPPRPPFRIDDAVRIIAAADADVNGHLVVRKGSIGQATVTGIAAQNSKYPTTCIDLRLDWISSLNGQQVPLRSGKKGKPHSDLLRVLSGHAGFFVDQTSLGRGLIEAMTFQEKLKALRGKLWVPAGTRMTGFVHGNISLDPAQLADAEARLPLPNTTGLLTIYRTKGQKDRKPDVYCDNKQLASLGPQQFFEAELTAGAHEVSVERSAPIHLEVSAGKEYYLYLRWHELTGAWKLESVTSPEGEDGVAEGEMISVFPN